MEVPVKTLFFLIAIVACSYISYAFSHDHASVHGMIVVGKQKVYLSHLPMFHSPHDYQVILEVELDQKGLSEYKKIQGLVTLVPEPFILPDMVKTPRLFKAEIFQGHFERGGVKKVNVVVSIRKVILSQKLNSAGSFPTIQEGFVFGEGEDQYLAHLIHGRPDFDQILSLQGYHPSGVVKFPGIDSRTSFQTGIIQTTNGKMNLKENIYYETGDLSH